MLLYISAKNIVCINSIVNLKVFYTIGIYRESHSIMVSMATIVSGEIESIMQRVQHEYLRNISFKLTQYFTFMAYLCQANLLGT